MKTIERPNILIVSKNLAIFEQLTERLKLKYAIYFAVDDKTTLEYAMTIQPDLILIGVHLPETGGFIICKQLKSNDKTQEIPVIFFSNSFEIEDQMKGLALGAVDYLTKPFNVDVVMIKIDNQLQSYQAFKRLKYEVAKGKAFSKHVLENEDRLKRIVDILQHPSETIQEFLDYSLKQAIEFTESQIGYIYNYDAQNKKFVLNTWSEEVMKECKVKQKQTVYELDKTGIWGEAVRQRRPIVVNDFKVENPLKKGYPQGHVHLNNFLTVPIFKKKQIVGVLGLANKKTDYDETDILKVTLLMEAVWSVTDRKKVEAALYESNTRYDKLVKRIPVGIYTIHMQTDGRIKFDYCSEKFCQLLGLKEAEIKNNSDAIINNIYEGDRNALITAANLALQQQQRLRWEGRSFFNGEIHWIRIESDPTELANGEIVFNGVAFDISEQKQAKERLNQTSIRLTLATQAGRVGIFDFDIIKNIILLDDLMIKLYGLEKDQCQINYESWRSFLHPQDRVQVEMKMKKAIEGGTEFDTEFRVVWPDGSIHNIRAQATVQCDSSGKVIRVIGTNWDITELKKAYHKTLETNRRLEDEIIERKQIEAALRESEEKLKIIIETSPDGIVISSMTGIVEFVTSKSVSMWGYDSSDEIIGKNIMEFVSQSYQAKARKLIAEMLNGHLTGAAEYLMIRKDGSLFYCEANANILRDSGNNPIGVLYIERDITDRKQLEDELKQLAIKDQLTGIFNRRKIDQVLDEEKERSDRNNQKLAIIIADIDMFKLVNDQFGHLVGDTVLTDVTKILGKGIRKTDVLGRWGGEEFMIICPNTDLAGATLLAEKLREMVSIHVFELVGRKTCSFGVAQLREDESIDDLLTRSDMALYRAKKQGRNRVEPETRK